MILRDGLENAPQAFIGLREDKNFGKPVIRVANVSFIHKLKESP
jgi:NADPH-dependent curcumin reductase CurA